jgi:hypothetical protein
MPQRAKEAPSCFCGVKGVGRERDCHDAYYGLGTWTSTADGREWCQCSCHFPERAPRTIKAS